MRQRNLLVTAVALVIFSMLLTMLLPMQTVQAAPDAQATPRPCVVKYPNGGCSRTPPGCTGTSGGYTCTQPGQQLHKCRYGYKIVSGRCVFDPNSPAWDDPGSD
jgi:hypothetical protein